MWQHYEAIEKLGQGAYGVVYKCRHKKTGEIFALKNITINDPNEGMPSTSLREISVLKELAGHPNIVKLVDVLHQEVIFLVFEFIPRDLQKFIRSSPGSELIPMEMVKSLTYQLLRGVLYCHQRRILHRDLKPANLLLDDNGVLKIADFGLARTLSVPVRNYTHEVVTLYYRAPEILLGKKRYACGVDMWSVACIFAELTTKKPLFQGSSEINQVYQIFRILGSPDIRLWPQLSDLPNENMPFPNFPCCLKDHVPRLQEDPLGMDLLQKMLKFPPAERMSAKEAVKHEFFDNLDKAMLPKYDDK